MSWGVYLVECSDGTLYCGATNDLKRRLKAHNGGKGAKYTRGKLPVVLMAWRDVGDQREALRLEIKVKKARRCRKVRVLNGELPESG